MRKGEATFASLSSRESLLEAGRGADRAALVFVEQKQQVNTACPDLVKKRVLSDPQYVDYLYIKTQSKRCL